MSVVYGCECALRVHFSTLFICTVLRCDRVYKTDRHSIDPRFLRALL